MLKWFGKSRRNSEPESWARRDLALEEAPASPWVSSFADLDEEDLGRPSYAPPSHYQTGWRRFIPQSARGRSRWWWAGRIVAVVMAVFFLLVAYLAFTAPLSKSLEPIAAPQITLLAADGTPIARNGAVVDEPVQVAELPDHVIQPFLAIEDRRFYSHWGVDPRGIARAIWTGRGGGSTITQQLAKFTFLSSERTLTRKAREALIAFWLESWLSKDEILERYLSNAYFGDNMYGLRAASLHYFYRHPEKLKPEQAAMLAGLLQAPSRLAPTRNPDLAAQRFALVKSSMVAAGYITQEQADALRVPELDVRTSYDIPTGTYFADWALPEARRLSEGGYVRETLTTTLDSRLQNIARRVTSRAPLGGAQVGLVAMRPSGEVVAMVGGKDYAQSPFNRATQAERQTGSTIKTLVYITALREGWGPDSTIANTEITEGSYRPRNANGKYTEEITLKDALATSSNVATLRLFNAVGSDAVIATARDYGITADLPEGDPSIALGTTSMTLLELTSAYAGIAGNQFPVEARAFPEEEGGWFDWLWGGKENLAWRHHEAIEDMLRAVINKGTGRAAMLRVPNYGKTGTTQEYRDALFVGYAGEGDKRLVVGIWIGNDDNTPLDGISGSGLPARMWRDFMRAALGGAAVPATPTPRPDPSGPVEPLDVPDLEDIPLGDNSSLSIRDGEALLESEIEGVPVGLRVRDGELVLEVDGETISTNDPP